MFQVKRKRSDHCQKRCSLATLEGVKWMKAEGADCHELDAVNQALSHHPIIARSVDLCTDLGHALAMWHHGRLGVPRANRRRRPASSHPRTRGRVQAGACCEACVCAAWQQRCLPLNLSTALLWGSQHPAPA